MSILYNLWQEGFTLYNKTHLLRAIQNIPIRKKITSIVFMALLSICIAFFLNLHFLTRQYDKDMYETNAQLLNNVISNIESEMAFVENLSNYIIADSNIQQNLTYLLENKNNTKAAVAKREAYESLYSYMFSNDYIKSITLVLDDTIITMGDSFPANQMDLDTLNQQAINDVGRPFWATGKSSNYSIFCTREIRQLKYLKLRTLAVLYIDVDMEQIITNALLDAGYSPNLVDFVVMQESEQIYPKETTHDIEALTSSWDSNAYHIDTFEGEKKFIITGSMHSVNWDYYYFRDYNRIFDHITKAKYYTMFYTIIFSLIALIFTNLSVQSILKHLGYLVEKITRFGKGITDSSKNRYHYEDRMDEIGTLHRSFDQMTHSVKVLRDENYDKQILLKDTSIKMLQQQINPHFLYNTLDTINWMAQMYGADDISTMALSLGNLFRASIAEQKDLIYLEHELEFLNNYIQIQKIRFKERLQFEITIPEQYHKMLIPKLCIQPLVENALKHAMEYSDETCIIQIRIEEEKDRYLLKVANTGSSFEENLLQKLEEHTLKAEGSGVGLTNINARMRLIYGEEYGLSFYNKDGMAVVVLSIPKTYKRDILDEETTLFI